VLSYKIRDVHQIGCFGPSVFVGLLLFCFPLESKTREVKTSGPFPRPKIQVRNMAFDGIDESVIIDWAIFLDLDL
jgi:hypothetical protein